MRSYDAPIDCLMSRRLLLAAPREWTAMHRAHLSACGSCAALARRLCEADYDIEDASLLSVPEGLAHRLRRAHPAQPPPRYAAGAVIAGTLLGLGMLLAGDVQAPVLSANAVGPSHPAVAALNVVADDSASGISPDGDSGRLASGLERLGLKVNAAEASAHYVGNCTADAGTECEHLVLSTPDAHANVMLVPNYPLPDSLLVADRHMVALVRPAGTGGYVVVADTAKTAHRMARLLRANPTPGRGSSLVPMH